MLAPRLTDAPVGRLPDDETSGPRFCQRNQSGETIARHSLHPTTSAGPPTQKVLCRLDPQADRHVGVHLWLLRGLLVL